MNFEKLAEGLAAFRKEAKVPRYVRNLMKKGITPKTPEMRKYVERAREGIADGRGLGHRPKVTDQRFSYRTKGNPYPVEYPLEKIIDAGVSKSRKLETSGLVGRGKAFVSSFRGKSRTPKSDALEDRLNAINLRMKERKEKASKARFLSDFLSTNEKRRRAGAKTLRYDTGARIGAERRVKNVPEIRAGRIGPQKLRARSDAKVFGGAAVGLGALGYGGYRGHRALRKRKATEIRGTNNGF